MRALTRAELARHPSRLLSSGRNRTKADIRIVEIEGRRVIVKDFRARGFAVRNTIGRFSMGRESRAYQRLGAMAGIPSFYGRIDAYAFACAFAGGRTLPDHDRRSLPRSFFQALESLIERVHGRGVAIADLHHRNVIVEEGTGNPVLIDFSLALTRPAPWNPPGRWLFDRAKRLDRIAFERLRGRYEAPGVEEPPSRTRPSATGRGPLDAREEPYPLLYRWGRSLKRMSRFARGKR